MHTYTDSSVTNLNQELCTTLEEADHCYTLMIEAGENPNIDRSGYTSQITLDVFRRLLSRPDLEAEEVAAILRKAEREDRRQKQRPSISRSRDGPARLLNSRTICR